ncbi:MAG: hypothetical protein LBH43_17285 [Treponema sp.]|jgi:hypothetical protein|nr:hypothetical protein [Treponema sp.]
MDKNQNQSLCDTGSGKCEYDFGSPDFTGDFNKLPPNIQNVANQIHEAAFGDKGQGIARP